MIRKIVTIDEKKCNGCGICINACHEGALKLVDGKAKLVSETYCDGLGDCLPGCPQGAITIEEKEAASYDEEAARENIKNMESTKPEAEAPLPCGCPGTHARKLKAHAMETSLSKNMNTAPLQSQLGQWPCQIKLVPAGAPYFDDAHLLIAADCTAYAYANIHEQFMKNKITLIGCPKLDDIDYSEKIAAILMQHEIKSVTVLRMEVPCCGGIASAVKNALMKCGKMIPWNIVTISTDGNIIED